MAIADHIPLAQSGNTRRNIGVAILYLLLLPVVLFAFPFYLLYAIGTNRNGLGDAVAESPLGSIPGVGGGGWSAAIVVFVIVLVALAAFGAVLPETDNTGEDTEPEMSSNGDDVESDEDGDSGDGATDNGGEDTTEGETDDGSDEGDPGDSGENSDDETDEDDTDSQTVDQPETVTFSGTGATVEEGVSIEGGLTVVDATHSGDSNFQVHLVDDTEYDEMFVNEIGDYSGETADLIDGGEYLLDVEADGDWEIEVRQPRANTGDDLPQSLEGEGPTVVGPIEFGDTHIAEGMHSGDSNFQVHVYPQYGSYGELVFNEIGEFEGETTFSHNEIGWVAIQADGGWELDLD